MEIKLQNTGSTFANDTERNKYFAEKPKENPLYDRITEFKSNNLKLLAGAYGLGKSRKN